MKTLVWGLLVVPFLLSACNEHNKLQLLNDEAALPATFKFDTLGLKVMTSFINKKSGITSILYANSQALNNAIKGDRKHSAGKMMALVTWRQKDDPSWIGARVPGTLQSVELLKTDTGTTGLKTAYTKYDGKNLLAATDTTGQKNRIDYILDLQPAIMP